MDLNSKSKNELIQELKKLQIQKDNAEKKLEDYKKSFDFKGLTQYTVDNIGDNIFWFDEKGKLLFVNESACKNLGYTKNEFLNISFVPDIDPYTTQEKLGKIWNEVKQKGSAVFETIHRTKDGIDIPVEVTANCFSYNGKEYSCDFVRDISERKNVQKSLQESEARFKALHNASFGGILIHDNGNILECNQGLSDITGYSMNELYSMDNFDLVSEESKKIVLNKVFKKDEKPYEIVGIRKNGEKYPLRLEARSIPYKGKIVRCVEFKDITEQKNAEKALRESEQKFKDLANLLPQTIFEIDLNMNITFFNKHALEEYGYTEEEAINNLSVIDNIAPEDREIMKQKIKLLFEENENVVGNSEFLALRKDGSTFPVKVYSNLIIKNNKPVGIRGISFNITDIKEAEEELQKQNSILEKQYEAHMQLNEVLRKTNFDLEIARERAEQSNKAKSIFLANMSHELRTPLFGMLGYSEMLIKLLEDEDLNEMAAGIHRTGKRLLNTLSLILDFSRMESDNFEVNTDKHEAINILTDVYENLKGGALAKNIEYLFKPHTNEMIINTDPEMFRIIFENIVGNALKFTSVGSVVLSTEMLKDDEQNLLSVKVLDTGIGIRQEDIPSVFDEFKQLSEGTTKDFQGSGLGLSITKKMVELLNGTIRVESKKDIGTSVVVNVPI